MDKKKKAKAKKKAKPVIRSEEYKYIETKLNKIKAQVPVTGAQKRHQQELIAKYVKELKSA